MTAAANGTKTRKAAVPRDRTGRPPAAARSRRSVPARRDRTDWSPALRTTAVSCLLGSGTIHGMLVVLHVGEGVSAGAFFLLLALAQTAVAFALATGTGRPTYLAAAVTSMTPLLVWAVSRTVGMPFGPDAGDPAPVGAADLIAGSFEVLTVLAILPLLVRHVPGRRGGAGALPPAGRLALCAVPLYALVLTFLAVVPAAVGDPEAGGSGGAGHDHAAHSHG